MAILIAESREMYENKQELWAVESSKFAQLRIWSNSPVTTFMNLATLVFGFFTIWIWIETRDDQKKKKEEIDISDLVEEWGWQFENLNLQLNDLKQSLQQVTCGFDAVYIGTKSSISQDCLQFIKPYQASTSTDTSTKSNYQNRIVKALS